MASSNLDASFGEGVKRCSKSFREATAANVQCKARRAAIGFPVGFSVDQVQDLT